MPITYKALVWRALLAGLLAGVLLAIYTLVVVEPTLDRALAIEDATAQVAGGANGHHSGEEPMFSRRTQVAGGLTATVIYAVVVSVIFATVLAKVRHRVAHLSELTCCGWLAAVAFGAVALIPGVKYPANPPGVGDRGNVDERTIQYLVLLALSIGLAVALVWLSGRLRAKLSTATRAVVVTATALAGYGLVLVALPNSPDAIDKAVPAQLVWDFRVRSLGGLALLWATIGLGLGWALERLVTPPQPLPDPATVAP